MASNATELDTAIASLQLPTEPRSFDEAILALQLLTTPRRWLLEAHDLFQMRILSHFLEYLRTCLKAANVPPSKLVLYDTTLAFSNQHKRENCFKVWLNSLDDEASKRVEKADYDAERKKWGLISSAMGEFSAGRPFLCLLYQSQHHAFEQSWANKAKRLASGSTSKSSGKTGDRVKKRRAADTVTDAEASHNSRNSEGHMYAVLIQSPKMIVYDPSFDADDLPSDRRLNNVPMLAAARYLRQQIRDKKGKNVIKEIWGGGGGNPSNRCMEMATEWILECVKRAAGVPGVPELDLSSYERLKL